MKAGQAWLYDTDTGDIVGVKDRDGGESIFGRIVTDANGNAVLVDQTGATVSLLGDILTVGAGGMYATIQEAIDAAGSRIELVDTLTATTLLSTSTTPSMTAAGLTGFSKTLGSGAHGVLAHGLLQVNASTKYFKIKSWDTTTIDTVAYIELYEKFDTSIVASATIRLYRINPVTILLLPGDHNTTTIPSTAGTPTGTVMQPGINIAALDGASIAISENTSSPNWLFQNLYENTFTNLTFKGIEAWGDMDSFGTVSPEAWGGAELTFINCNIDHLNNNTHMNGASQAPVIAGGFTRFIRSTIRETRNGWFKYGGRVTASNDNTIVEFIDSVTIPYNDTDSIGGNMNPMSMGMAAATDLGTFNFYNHRIVQHIDYANKPNVAGSAFDNWGEFYIGSPCIVNWYGGCIDIKNTSGVASNTVGIETGAAATVNLFNTAIRAFGTGATGIINNGATINLHNTYVEGATNSINNVSGTVNVEKGCTLNGPVTGTISSTVRGVATLVGGTVTVNTSKVHANSRIKLCHQTTGGTPGILTLGTVTAGTSFVINSTSGTDTSTVLWELEH
jgi:hypothetical protein